MGNRTRAVNARSISNNHCAVDPCVTKIEALWTAAGDSVEHLAKSLRLLVFYVRTSDGVPERFNSSVRTKIARLESMLDGMSLEDAIFAIPSIKYARRQLRTYVVYGTKFGAAVSKADQAKAERIGKRIELNGSGTGDFNPAGINGDDELDGFPSGGLDDEEFSE